jgi:hypothetical protein
VFHSALPPRAPVDRTGLPAAAVRVLGTLATLELTQAAGFHAQRIGVVSARARRSDGLNALPTGKRSSRRSDGDRPRIFDWMRSGTGSPRGRRLTLCERQGGRRALGAGPSCLGSGAGLRYLVIVIDSDLVVVVVVPG